MYNNIVQQLCTTALHKNIVQQHCTTTMLIKGEADKLKEFAIGDQSKFPPLQLILTQARNEMIVIEAETR